MASAIRALLTPLLWDASSSSPSPSPSSEVTQKEAELWNKSASRLHRLPKDVRLMLWLLCDAPLLLHLRLSCVLLGLRDLDIRSPFWRLWSDDQLRRGAWRSFSVNVPSVSAAPLRSAVRRLLLLEGEHDDERDAAAFVLALRNHRENARPVRAAAAPAAAADPSAAWSLQAPPSLFGRLLAEPAFFVPIFGNALETSARRLVYRLMWGSENALPLFPVKGVFPGSGGKGGGVTFSVGRAGANGRGRTLKLAPFYSWSGKLDVNAGLEEVCRACQGLCFVVDDQVLAREDGPELADVRNMLHTLLPLAEPTVPILILNFAAAEAPRHGSDPRRVLDVLGFAPETRRVVSVRNVPESTDTGVAEGIEWLVETMASV